MRACKVCKTRFEGKGFVNWCSAECGSKLAIARLEKRRRSDTRTILAKEKAERKADKAKRESLKTRSDYINDAKTAFHKYVRLRDYGKTCISCPTILGDPVVGGSYDAGHWRSVGSAPHLRFDERNVHGQCKRCNRWGSGMASDYRRGLLHRFGLDLVEALEADQEPRKFTIEDLQAIKAKYRELARQLEKQP